jgi:uncharacterized repeat protein (TIGR03803 family)
MWLSQLRQQWFGKSKSARPARAARPRSARLRIRQLETRLTPSGISTLVAFNGANGAYPDESLVMDSNRNLYGMTQNGPYGDGTIFELAYGTAAVMTLATFNAEAAGTESPLLLDSAGNLYGIAGSAVFELPHGSSTITTLASFNSSTGSEPRSSLVMDSSGNLYGTTYAGGASNRGTVFEVAKGSGTITTLASFSGPDGSGPLGALVIDGSGNLYGTTAYGGAYGGTVGYGTVFEVPAGTGTITTLASFNYYAGAYPAGGLLMDSKGNLYGATGAGGPSDSGTVFELAQGSGKITRLASFNASGTNGNTPNGPLVMDSRGDLYGTTQQGGPLAYSEGNVFELAQGSHQITSLGYFNGTGGINVKVDAGLTMDSSGDLYGTTFEGGEGGADGAGTIFELPGAAAQPDQWTGANFAVDTNWSDGANWSLGTPPTAEQAAIFTNNSSVKDFTSTVDPGFTNTVGGLVIDSTWDGTITVDSPLSVNGNFSQASGSLGGGGAMTIDGDAMHWTGGQIDVGAGGFTNAGVLNASTGAGDLVLTGTGTLTNDGTLDKAGGTGTLTISTATLDNPGTVEVGSGALKVAAAVTEVSGSTLTAGGWFVGTGAAARAELDLTAAPGLTTIGSAAAVALDGPKTSFTNLSRLTTVAQGGSFSVLGGRSFTTTRGLTNRGLLTVGTSSNLTTGAFTNHGDLILGPGSVLTVNGSFTQLSDGTLIVEIAGTATARRSGSSSAPPAPWPWPAASPWGPRWCPPWPARSSCWTTAAPRRSAAISRACPRARRSR